MFPKFGPIELILIIVIVTMLFGVGKLPELFGSVGRGVREFRKNAEGDGADTPAATSNRRNPTNDPNRTRRIIYRAIKTEPLPEALKAFGRISPNNLSSVTTQFVE